MLNKKRIGYLLMSTLCLQSCQKNAVLAPGGQEEVLYIITDMHYLSPDLYRKDSGTFQQILATNDSKMIEDMPQIMEQFTETVCTNKPHAVLVSGDITFNGEMVSLQEIKPYFERMEEAGVDVLVIPGNHDIAYPYAESYLGDRAVYVENISQKQFLHEMKSFGLSQALSVDSSSFSYLYPLSEDLYILAIDVNTEDHPGKVSEKTVAWMKEAFAIAKKNHAKVITMSHQNVLKHSDIIYKGYVMDNFEEVSEILQKNDVSLNLSGHSHLQHTSEEGNLTDICNESLAVYPLSYGVVTIDGKRAGYSYERKSVEIPLEHAKERFLSRTVNQTMAQLEDINAPKQVLRQMSELVAEVNLTMFTGQTLDEKKLLQDERWLDWQKYGQDVFWYSYIQNFLESQD